MHLFIEYHVILFRCVSRLIVYFIRIEKVIVVAGDRFLSVWLCHVYFCAVHGNVEDATID
jgi:hypothetical protein